MKKKVEIIKRTSEWKTVESGCVDQSNLAIRYDASEPTRPNQSTVATGHHWWAGSGLLSLVGMSKFHKA